MSAWFLPALDDRTLVLACIFYGFVVVVIGVVSCVLPRKVPDVRLRNALWLLGAFGLLHGVRAFLEVGQLCAPRSTSLGTLYVLDVVGKYMNVVALACLAQFTAEICAVARRGAAWLRWVPLAGLVLWISTVIVPLLSTHPEWVPLQPAGGLILPF